MKFPVRLELVKGTSAKFYTVAIDGKTIRTTWGRIGTAGSSKEIRVNYYIDIEAERLVRAKLREGYERVVPGLRRKLEVGAKAKVDAADAATAKELASIAKAIAARTTKLATKRFVLRWDDGITTGGMINIGDPVGTNIQTEAFVHGSDRFCFLSEPGNKAAGEILGVRLNDTATVTWQRYQPFTITKLFGAWSEGFTPKQLVKAGYLATKSVQRGRLFATRAPGTYESVAGLDVNGRPTFLLFGPHLRIGLFAELLTEAPTGQRDPFLPPDTTATAAELSALGIAIAAGVRRKQLSPRFALAPIAGTVKPVDGKLVFGDPNGPHDVIDAGAKDDITFTRVVDKTVDPDGYSPVWLAARLRPNAAVTWKPSTQIEMTSGYYGIWSPGYPTDDIEKAGVFKHGQLGAQIHWNHCSSDTGTCSSLVGFDAKQRPVALIFGYELDSSTFAR